MTRTHVPVLIVGAGAAGLSASALLAKHGVGSLVVERRREVFIYPKARNLSFRSLEILRGLGLGDEVHAVAERVSDMVAKTTLNSPEQQPAIDLSSLFAGLDGLSPEPVIQYCPQSRLEPILLADTRRRGNQVCYGTELASFEQDDAGVTAVLRDLKSEQTQIVRADYLLAADGVHSGIRKSLGVPTSGYGALPIYVVFVYFRAPWRRFVPELGDGDGILVKNDTVDGIVLSAGADLGMFITTYFPDTGETAAQFTSARCRDLVLEAVGEPIDIEIIDVAAWQPYEQVADQFRTGRTFFVGDSAHTMPPFKAGGANAAIQSAHNLAWKLAAVLNGMAGSELLDTYHDERHPIGRFSARQSLTGPTLALLRLDDNRPLLPPDEEAPMFALLVGYQYRSAAVISDQPASTEPDGVHLVDALRGQPGTRVPHGWISRDGTTVSTLDLLGPGFTLLTADKRWQAAVTSASTGLGVPLTMECLDSDEWTAATGLGPGGAVLVRPDDFIGRRTESWPGRPESELTQALSAILCRD